MTIDLRPHAGPAADEPHAPRSVAGAMWRGLRLKCPNCGRGRMFRRYLKVADSCNSCGEALHHHRADDAPPYFTILIVGHLLLPLVVAVETALRPALWVHAALWLPLTLGVTLIALAHVKGSIVALQWALYMHGFDPHGSADEPIVR